MTIELKLALKVGGSAVEAGMPKMRSCLSERASRSSSKTSEDKTNMVLLASRGPADTDQASQEELLCSSEKDSGYSDNGSDWQQMDGDDQCSSVSEPQSMDTLQGQETVKALHPGSTMQGQETVKHLHQSSTLQGQETVKHLHQSSTMQGQKTVKPFHQSSTMQGQKTVKPFHQSSTMQGQKTVKPLHQGSTMQGHRASELTPVYVLKNVVLKQPVPVQNGSDQLIQSHLTWSNTGGVDSSGPTHVILLQPPSTSIPSPSSTKRRKAPFRRTNKKTKGAFLPTLSSYTRIAPHPGKKRPDEPPAGLGKGTDSEGQSLSKRIHTDLKRDEVSTTTTDVQLRKQRPHKQSGSRTHRLGTIAFPPSSPSTVSSSRGCPSVSSLEMSTMCSSSNSASPPSATRGTHNGPSNAQHCRFHNTLEILSQSGLLDITLRTKDLLSQSNATERDIAKLRQHTELLCQAVSGTNDSRGCVTLETLHKTMEESGDYPTLKCLDLHTTQTLNGSNVPSTPIGSVQESSLNHPLSHDGMLTGTASLPPEQRNESKPGSTPSENFTFIPPDSSTHWGIF